MKKTTWPARPSEAISLCHFPRSTTSAWPAIRGPNSTFELYFDSGVRCAADVVKALCLGARGVGLGRLYLGMKKGGQNIEEPRDSARREDSIYEIYY